MQAKQNNLQESYNALEKALELSGSASDQAKLLAVREAFEKSLKTPQDVDGAPTYRRQRGKGVSQQPAKLKRPHTAGP